jgi:anti-sigma factor RsiW
MKHPNQATLALHAGGDLNPWIRWRTERHLAHCEECRREIAAFDDLREIVPDLAETPEIPWNRLAAEMKANIRLGLAAGECVRPVEPVRAGRLFSGARAAVALASVLALLVTGIVVERPAPAPAREAADTVMMQMTPDGIQLREGTQSWRLMHSSAQKDSVHYQMGAQGSVEARYVDSNTGYVMVNKIDVD